MKSVQYNLCASVYVLMEPTPFELTKALLSQRMHFHVSANVINTIKQIGNKLKFFENDPT